VGHQGDLGKQLSLEVVLDALRKPMTNPEIPKVGHNLKYDFVMLARQGVRVTPLAFDTMIAEWLTNPASHNLGLKNLAWVRLDFKMTEIEELIGKGKNQRLMSAVPIQEAGAYAAADAIAVLRLMPVLQGELEASNSTHLLKDIEIPLISVLADMEMTGISLNTTFLSQMSGELSGRMKEIEQKVYEAVGQSFNINSTQQLSEALFTKLKLEPLTGRNALPVDTIRLCGCPWSF
jgi:DNA polymerase-1